MTRTTVEERLSGQQERAYGGSVWAGTITFEMQLRSDAEWEPWASASESHADRWVRFLTHYQPHGEGDWFTPRLESLVETAPGVWTYRVKRPYDD